MQGEKEDSGSIHGAQAVGGADQSLQERECNNALVIYFHVGVSPKPSLSASIQGYHDSLVRFICLSLWNGLLLLPSSTRSAKTVL